MSCDAAKEKKNSLHGAPHKVSKTRLGVRIRFSCYNSINGLFVLSSFDSVDINLRPCCTKQFFLQLATQRCKLREIKFTCNTLFCNCNCCVASCKKSRTTLYFSQGCETSCLRVTSPLQLERFFIRHRCVASCKKSCLV